MVQNNDAASCLASRKMLGPPMGWLTPSARVGLLAASALVAVLVTVTAMRVGRPDEPGIDRDVLGPQTADRSGAGTEWGRVVVSARELRRRGLAGWPAAVGVWWPECSGAGVLVCRDCVDVRPTSAIGSRRDEAAAVVLFGPGARQRVERRCAVHTGRFPGGGTARPFGP